MPSNSPNAKRLHVAWVRNKGLLIQMKGGACQRCGFSGHPAALDFHHRDPAAKSFGIARKLSCRFGRLAAEAEKCDLLCANCHRVVEYEKTERHD